MWAGFIAHLSWVGTNLGQHAAVLAHAQFIGSQFATKYDHHLKGRFVLLKALRKLCAARPKMYWTTLHFMNVVECFPSGQVLGEFAIACCTHYVVHMHH